MLSTAFATCCKNCSSTTRPSKSQSFLTPAAQLFVTTFNPDYKAHRPPPPDELIPQFALIRDATRAFGLPSIEAAGFEADDIIAAYAREAVAKKQDVRIVSSDKDLMQLIRPGVEMFDPLKSIPIGEAEVFKKFGVAPDRVTDVQALAGDSTDNIPGVPGIGVKTAAELILQYGGLEELLNRAAEIKQPKRRQLLLEHADKARISKKLVMLDDAAPLPLPLEKLVRDPNHKEDLAKFLLEQGFRSILTRMDLKTPEKGVESPPLHPLNVPPIRQNSSAEAFKQVATKYELIQDEERLKWWVEAAYKKGHLAFDTETTSLTPSTTTLVGISLALAPGEACYIPCNHCDPKHTAEAGSLSFTTEAPPKQIPLSRIVSLLKDLLQAPSVLKVAHNLKFDLQVLEQHGLTVSPYDDTMLLSYCLAAGKQGHGMDELALLHFNHKMISYSDVTGSGRNQITFDRVPLDKACDYAAEDADFVIRLWQFLKPQIAEQHVTRVYERIERPLVPVVASMERTGIRIDPEILKGQSHGFATRMQKLEEEIYKLAGHPFNVGSPKQLGDVLFAEMSLPGGTKGKTGAYSTSSDVLEPLGEMGHDIVTKVLEWRGIAKLKSTYTDSLPLQIDTKSQRVHTSFSMVGAATGRLASTDPNLQNIPIRTEDGRAIRRAFIADDGFQLMSVDYSQIELRLAAEMAGIKALVQAFHDGVDIHALTASQVFGIPLKELPPDRRRAAKAINFGIIYGISGFGLAKQIGITPSEANEFIRQYLDRFFELREWLEKTKEFARQNEYVETLFGRRIHVRGIREKIAFRRQSAERVAINAPLQGTAADIIKRAMIRIGPALKAEGLGGSSSLAGA